MVGVQLEANVDFDFEGFLRSEIDSRSAAASGGGGGPSHATSDSKLHTVVCRHWLQGLCQKGSKCEYLHKLDKSKMQSCIHGKQCKMKICLRKHEDEEEKEECAFFRQGFCVHGPFCKYRHVKRSADECPEVVAFDQFGTVATSSMPRKRKTAEPNSLYKVTLCKHWLEQDNCPFAENCHYAHGEEEMRSFFALDEQDDRVYDPTRSRMDCPLAMPFAAPSQPGSAAYFVLQAPDLRTLRIGKERGTWVVTPNVARDINAVVGGAVAPQRVVILFMVKSLFGIYGIASIDTSSQLPIASSGILSNYFAINWMRSVRISLKTIHQYRTPIAGTNIGKLETDARLENNIGSELLHIAYRKPEWDWVKDIARASPVPVPPSEDPGTSLADLLPREWIDKLAQGPSALSKSFGATGNYSIGLRGATHSVYAPHPSSSGSAGTAAAPGGVQSQQYSAAEAHSQVVDSYYPGHIAGFVVGCTSDMMDECFKRSLFGLPIQNQTEALRYIVPGAPLFLIDVQSGTMFGIFEATSPAGIQLDRSAWTRGGALSESPLPVQVRFRPILQCPAVPDADAETSRLFPGRQMAQRIGPLDLNTTKRLVNIFAIRAGAWVPPQTSTRIPTQPPHFPTAGAAPTPSVTGPVSAPMPRQLPPRPHPPAPFAPNGALQPPFGASKTFRPQFRNNDTVFVGIPFVGDGFLLRKRLLGPQVSRIMNVINNIPGGNQNNIKIRLRGIGSGFREGVDQSELPEPLQFSVSTELPEHLPVAVARVRELIAQVSSEMQ